MMKYVSSLLLLTLAACGGSVQTSADKKPLGASDADGEGSTAHASDAASDSGDRCAKIPEADCRTMNSCYAAYEPVCPDDEPCFDRYVGCQTPGDVPRVLGAPADRCATYDQAQCVTMNSCRPVYSEVCDDACAKPSLEECHDADPECYPFASCATP